MMCNYPLQLRNKSLIKFTRQSNSTITSQLRNLKYRRLNY